MPIPGLMAALPAIGAGVSGLLGYLGQRGQNRQLERDQRYTNQTRGIAGNQADMILNNPSSFFLGPDPRSIQEQAAQFHNPYQSQVIEGIQGQFNRLREQAHLNQGAGATLAGAFGGDRHQLQLGARLGELDLGETQQIGNLLHQDWYSSVDRGLQYSEYQRALRERQAQEPIFRAETAIGLRNQGMGPVGLPRGGSALAAGLGAATSAYPAISGFLDRWRNPNRGSGMMMGMLPGAMA